MKNCVLCATVALLFTAHLACTRQPPVRALYMPAECDRPHLDEPWPEENVERLTRATARLKARSILSTTSGILLKSVSAPPEEAPSPDQRVNINTASVEELTRLPGIGPKTAESIVAFRSRRAFSRPSELRRVKGIGRSKYERIADQITVE